MTTTQIDALIASITDNGRNKALKVRTVLTAIKADLWRIGEVREFDVDNAFITTNFDGTGLGTGDYLGFAICNGTNTTKNRGKRSPLGYDPASSYNILGTLGGYADSTLPEHSHTTATGTGVNKGANGYPDPTIPNRASVDTSINGVSATNKNYHPYLITLFIQRIA